MEQLERCPFCGGKSAIRGKIQARVKARDYFSDAIQYQHRYGYQPYCARCYTKMQYVWGDWHDEEPKERGESSKVQMWHLIESKEREQLMAKAADNWNTRKGE